MSFPLNCTGPMGFGIGSPSPVQLPCGGDGAVMHFSPDGITVFISLASPDSYERGALKASHPTRAGVCSHDRLGFLVMDFGQGLRFDAPFDAGIVPPEKLANLQLETNNSRVSITLVGVDSTSDRVFGIRLATLSPRVSRAFVGLLQHQANKPISASHYSFLLNDAYSRYQSTEALALKVAAFDRFGVSDHFENTNIGPIFLK